MQSYGLVRRSDGEIWRKAEIHNQKIRKHLSTVEPWCYSKPNIFHSSTQWWIHTELLHGSRPFLPHKPMQACRTSEARFLAACLCCSASWSAAWRARRQRSDSFHDEPLSLWQKTGVLLLEMWTKPGWDNRACKQRCSWVRNFKEIQAWRKICFMVYKG